MPRLFTCYGVELEYMLVDAQSLDVRPICDDLLTDAAGVLTAGLVLACILPVGLAALAIIPGARSLVDQLRGASGGKGALAGRTRTIALASGPDRITDHGMDRSSLQFARSLCPAYRTRMKAYLFAKPIDHVIARADRGR